ncbi:MAG TPA: MmgE/PrpD family protein, partial [Thermomicrobiales bacterium]|nr:MmgE/PrpD family protein [Thermomicrobiales bacterium]
MSDNLTRALAAYVVSDVEVEPKVRREARRRILDSIGVAFAALDHPGPRAVRSYAATAFPEGGPATVWGSDRRVPVEVAALVNGVAVRCLDYNDNYFSLGGGHPSDMIGGLLALAEVRNRSGAELLDAVVIGYEIGASYNDSLNMRERGWDQTNMLGMAAWGGVVRLLGLNQAQAEDALGITVVPRVGLGQARYGNVPMWKGFAGPDAVRFAVYAGLLAEAGVQGPFEPLEGKRGFLQALFDGVIANPEGLQGIFEMRPPSGILRGNMKAWPLGSVAQNAVSAAVEVHRRLEPGEEVRTVTIRTFDVSIEVMGSPEKYRPRTRETADHSLPYTVVAALRQGEINEESFSPDRYASE